MSEEGKNSKGESFSLMKHWLMTKFQTPAGGNRQDSIGSNVLPKIVISRGSNKSINKMVSPANSPDFKRPRSLVRTWISSSHRDTGPMSAPHNATKSFFSPTLHRNFNENHQPSTPQLTSSTRISQSTSLPCSPLQQVYLPVASASVDGTVSIKSPVFRFSQRKNVPFSGGLTPGRSCAWSRSDIDSDSVCGACGHKKYFGSREFVGFMSIPPHNKDKEVQSAVNSPKLPHRQLTLRRTSSCRAPDNLERQLFQKSATIKKAASNMDVQKRSSSKKTQVRRTGSKERHRSTISLTRSWSINLDTFRIVRNNSLKSGNVTDRKMSLNDMELRRQKEDRRRSSILRLLCHDKTDSEKDKFETISISDSNHSEEEISTYSPEVTRANKVCNSDPLEDFRSTLESESFKIPSIYGQIKLMFQYFNEKKEFQVTILKGSNVAPGQTGTLGIYIKVCLMPGKIQTKTGDDKHDTRNPVFYEPFTFKMSLDELLQRRLRLKLYNKPGILSASLPIGECNIDLYNYDLTAVTVIWQDLNRCKSQKDELEEFDFSPLERHQRKRRNLRYFLCGIGRGNVSVDEAPL